MDGATELTAADVDRCGGSGLVRAIVAILDGYTSRVGGEEAGYRRSLRTIKV